MNKKIFTICCIAIVFSLVMAGCNNAKSDKNTKKGTPLALIHEGTVTGFVDTEGSLVIDLSDYINAIPFSEGLAAVKNGESKWGFIDTKGKEVIPCVFDCDDEGNECREALMFHDGYANMAGLGLIDRKGNIIIQNSYIIDWNNEIAVVGNDKYFSQCILLDITGKQISETVYQILRICDNGMVLCKTGEGWGYLDSKGNTVVEPQYKEAYFYEDGLALVIDQNNKAMLIDEKGNVKKNLDYCPKFIGRSDVNYFREGFAVVDNEEELWGAQGRCMYVNNQFEPQFGMANYDGSPFHDGYAAVQDQDSKLWGFIDNKGNCMVEPRYKGIEVKVCDDGYGIVKDYSHVNVVNIKKKSDIQLVSAWNIVANRMWVKVSNVRDANGYPQTLYGIATPDGQEIMPLSQYSVEDFHYTESDNSDGIYNK